MKSHQPPTPAQLAALAAGRLLLGTKKCLGCEERIGVAECSDLCRHCIDSRRLAERDLSVLDEMPTVYLNTETTGLNGGFAERGDEIVEISICNDAGQAIIHSLVKPAATAWPGAQAVHGISPRDVRKATELADLLPAVLDAIRGKRVVIYNAEFHEEFFPRDTFDSCQVECCMLKFAEVKGEWSDHFESWRLHKLAAAAKHVGHGWTSDADRALAGALATRSVWHWLKLQKA